ncbi:MAG TPA: hypothetical protein VGF59_06925, partial [Bryobacteraceae bacterium]
MTVTLLNNYTGLDFSQTNSLQASGGFVPPDTTGAAGPNSYVEAVNQSVAIYTPKTTGTGVKDSLADFFFTKGGLTPIAPPATDAQSDSFVIWDSQVQRFI